MIMTRRLLLIVGMVQRGGGGRGHVIVTTVRTTVHQASIAISATSAVVVVAIVVVAAMIVRAQRYRTAHAVVLFALMLQQAGLPHRDKVAARVVALVFLVASVLKHVSAQVAQKVWRVAAVWPRAPVAPNATVACTLVLTHHAWWAGVVSDGTGVLQR